MTFYLVKRVDKNQADLLIRVRYMRIRIKHFLKVLDTDLEVQNVG